MKIIVVFTFAIVFGCILASGCVSETKKNNDSAKNDSVSVETFASFTLPSPNVTKGPLKVSLEGWVGEFPVFVDKTRAGVVATKKPLSLMLDEGNHTVEVCCGDICEKENITIQFGKHQTIDFSEQLKDDLVVPEPTVRIVNYFLNGEQISIEVEFYNPTSRTLNMSAAISCGYSYIDGRTNSRLGNSAQGYLSEIVKPCERKIPVLELSLASGPGFNYDMPTINDFSIN